MVSQARRTIDNSIVSQSRVRLIQCQCKLRLQIPNLGINNMFLIKSSLFDHAVYICHLVLRNSAANQECVIGRYSDVPLAVYAHQNNGAKWFNILPQIHKITATSGSSDSIDTYVIQKPLDCHLNFWKCTLTVEYIAVLRDATLLFGENKMAGRATISAKNMASSWLFMHKRL